MGSGDDLHADDLANPAGRGGPGVDRRLHGRHVADDERRDQAAADLVPAGKFDVRRLEHRIGRFDQRDKPFRFDHSECFVDRSIGHHRSPAVRPSPGVTLPAASAWFVVVSVRFVAADG